MNKKLIWILVGLAAVVILLVGLKKAGVIGKKLGEEVTAEKVQLRTITESVNASGKVYPEIEVKVSPDISGEIVNLFVEEGDKVVKGQILAKIYADIYSSQRDQVTASVNQVKAQYENVKANLSGLKTAYENTKSTNERYKKLFADKIVSRAEFEQTEQAFRSAESSYFGAQETIKSSAAQIQGVRAQLARAEKDLARTTITSPMDGIVSLMNVKKGERVVGTAQMAGTEMMRVADMKSIEVRVDVGENDITKVKIGDTALVEVDAYNNRKFKGIVYKIANPVTSANAGLSSSTEVANYKVHIRLFPDSYVDLLKENAIFPFRPGMTASADIQTKSKVNVITVPLNAVTTRDKEGKGKDTKAATSSTEKGANENSPKDDDVMEVVFVLQKDNKVKMVKVKTDIQDLNYIEIAGVKVGDQVITGPYSTVSKSLKDGALVKVTTKDKLFDEKK
ncbi:MAG: efflux RND transporter periplasmic adaptor subunit [Sediminibacterium sp.]